MSTNKKKYVGQKGSCCDEEPSSSQPLADNRNPMLIPLVLDRFFNFCNTKDLPQFRLVCKEWHSVSLTRSRKEMIVKIHKTPSQPAHGVYSNIGKGWLRWETMNDELELGDKPFSSFFLKNLQFGSSSQTPNQSSMIHFWRKQGENIRKLELNRCTIVSMKAYKKAIFERLPNLEELKLVDLEHHERLYMSRTRGNSDVAVDAVRVHQNLKTFIVTTAYDTLPAPWRVTFAHFPNIQRLELSQEADYTKLVNTLEDLSQPPVELTIRHLTLGLSYGNNPKKQATALKRLFQLPILKLEILEANMDGLEDREKSVLPVALHRHGATLMKLEVSVPDHTRLPYYDSFPVYTDTFSSLAELRLSGKICGNLHFLEQMPNLATLDLSFHHYQIFNETNFGRMTTLRLPSLRDVDFGDTIISENQMECLVTLMPNVQTFGGGFITPAFRLICNKWRYLRKLSITSGLDAKHYNPIRGVEGIGDEGITGVVAGREERLPNLTYLKYLTSFTLVTKEEISEISVTEGILKLPGINNISLRGSIPSEITDETYQILLKHCSKVYIYWATGASPSPSLVDDESIEEDESSESEL